MPTELETRNAQRATSLDIREALRLMLTIRHFDERALALYRAGEMRGTTHPYIGMEAVGVGVTLALRPDDYVTSTHRGHGHTIAKGGEPRKMMAELLGRATGYSGGKLRGLARQGLHVPLDDMGIVESIHLTAFHWVVDDLHRRISL